jgi:hypothetical protein
MRDTSRGWMQQDYPAKWKGISSSGKGTRKWESPGNKKHMKRSKEGAERTGAVAENSSRRQHQVVATAEAVAKSNSRRQ